MSSSVIKGSMYIPKQFPSSTLGACVQIEDIVTIPFQSYANICVITGNVLALIDLLISLRFSSFPSQLHEVLNLLVCHGNQTLYFWLAQHIMTAYDGDVGLTWGLTLNHCKL